MVSVKFKKDKSEVNTGEIIFEDKKTFKIHSDNRIFNKNKYTYKTIL